MLGKIISKRLQNKLEVHTLKEKRLSHSQVDYALHDFKTAKQLILFQIILYFSFLFYMKFCHPEFIFILDNSV